MRGFISPIPLGINANFYTIRRASENFVINDNWYIDLVFICCKSHDGEQKKYLSVNILSMTFAWVLLIATGWEGHFMLKMVLLSFWRASVASEQKM